MLVKLLIAVQKLITTEDTEIRTTKIVRRWADRLSIRMVNREKNGISCLWESLMTLLMIKILLRDETNTINRI